MAFDTNKKSDTIFSDDFETSDISALEQMLEDAAQSIAIADTSNVEKFYISVSIQAQYDESEE